MKSLMKIEDDQLIENFLNKTFFEAWKPENKDVNIYKNYRSLELQINAACDLKCKYCYYAKYKKDLYPPSIAKHSLTMKNLEIVLNWLTENNYQPNIEVFSGEPFMQEIGFQVTERLIEWCNDNKIETKLMIPTNFTFLFDEVKTKRIEKMIEDSNRQMCLSASVDGKYCDANRPFANGQTVRDDAYYEKMFKFVKKHRYAFHPMIYNEHIENWKDNWLWYQENMKKHNIPFTSIYLLEVRNPEWNKKQLQEFYKFIRFVVNWSWNHVKGNVSPELFPKFVFDNKLFNLFSMFATVGRGLGCSMQSTVQLRLGDLTTSVCHRTAYKPHNLWKFVTENDKITGIEAINPNLALAVNSFDFRTNPHCCYCSIRDMCNGQCLGAMHEQHGDVFTPIPTVCALEHAKVAGMLDELKELDLFKHFYGWIHPIKQKTLKVYDEMFYRGRN